MGELAKDWSRHYAQEAGGGFVRAFLRWVFVFWLFSISLPLVAEPATETLRVQLQWYHQSQFAGIYVAEARRHFENAGLRVEVVQGGTGIDPLARLQEREVDIAVGWLANAWKHGSAGDVPVTNIAQLTASSSLVVLCRLSSGVLRPTDLMGRQVGVWGLGDQYMVAEMLRRLQIPEGSVEIVEQRPNGVDLIEGRLPCVTAMNYNEYWKVLAAGVPATDLLIVEPEVFGIYLPEDGLYVLADRLDSPEFRDQLVRFLSALRRGWAETRIAPTLALETVQRMAPGLDREHQRHMLETILATIPPEERFGLLELGQYQVAIDLLSRHADADYVPERLWTHVIWNRLRVLDGQPSPLTESTRHYLRSIMEMTAFKIFLAFGVFTFALSGVLEAVNRGYDLWGRLILAYLSGLGGGTIRDFLIGGERQPLEYLQDMTLPAGIVAIVLLTSLVTALRPSFHQTVVFKAVKVYADIIGFSVLAAGGATIAIVSGLHWAWAPIFAAISCAGGGMLRDIVINREPASFKGVIYEEAAIIGSAVFVAGLFIANFFEQSPLPVYAAFASGVLMVMLIRFVVHRWNLRYPGVLRG
jgi:NitT/TauT family transport system substrate-binding protein